LSAEALLVPKQKRYRRRHIARVRFFIKASLVALAAFLAPAHAETTLHIGDQKGNARSVLEAAGALEGIPYAIEWREFAAAAPLLEAANAGAIDAGTVGDGPFTFAVAAGVPIKAIAATRWNAESLAVLVRKESPVKTFRELSGKRIATGKGSIGHQLVLALLERDGLKPSDIELAFLPPSDAASAFQGGSVDAWATWEPYTSQMEIAAGAHIVAHAGNLTSGLTFFVARDDAIASPPKSAALRDFVTRLARARAWALAHLPEYAVSWSKITGLSQAVVLKALERQSIHAVPVDDSVAEDEQKTIDLYVRAGLLRQRLNATDLLDRRFGAVSAAGFGQQ
jgi:sulfonate transport system substrate-binding protein